MSLINCPSCGKQISDKAEKCPHCGKMLALSEVGMDEKSRPCQECGSMIPAGATVCPNCGCPVSAWSSGPVKPAEGLKEKSQESEAQAQKETIMPEDHTEQLITNGSENQTEIRNNENKNVSEENKPSGSAKKVILVAVILLIVVAAAYFGTAKMRAYSQAKKKYDAGEYNAAYDSFTSLGEYKDSIELADDCMYHMADADYKAGDYPSAKEKYESIETYKDSKTRIEDCVYQMADADYKAEDFASAKEKYLSIKSYKDSAQKVTDCEYQMSIDGQFLRELSKGLSDRWDQNAKDEENGYEKDEPTSMAKYCDLELNHVEKFEKEKFDNKELGKDAVEYIKMLKAAKEATTYYTVDYSKYNTDWSNVYQKRTQLLQKISKDYNLIIDEKHQDVWNDLMRDATASAKLEDAKKEIQEMTDTFELTVVSEEYGYKDYSLHMKNTTKYTFDYFYVEISLLDEKGNIVDTGDVNQISNWEPGQSADMEAWISNDTDPFKYKITYYPHYSTVDGTIYD